jgi:hypothetical protein
LNSSSSSSSSSSGNSRTSSSDAITVLVQSDHRVQCGAGSSGSHSCKA